MTSDQDNKTFFKASGWLVIATTLGGVGMFLVQVVAVEWLEAEEYGLMNTLFQTLNLAMIPALGLQTVFAQQAASAFSPAEKLATFKAAKNVLRAITGLWSILALIFLFSQNYWSSLIKAPSTLPLWLTLGAALPQLCLPVWMGVLQGQQSFFWLGNGVILNGFGRFFSACALVGLLSWGVSGAVGAALAGFLVSSFLCYFSVKRPSERDKKSFDWGNWAKKILPLTLGLGSSTFFLGYDMIVVRIHFEEALTGYYGAAGLCGRGLVIFTIPIAQVMFPMIVKLSSKKEKTSGIVKQTFLITAGLAVVVSLLVTLGSWILSISLNGSWDWGLSVINNLNAEQKMKLKYISLLAPYFCWAMTPLCLANVLINHLIAMKAYRHLWMLVSVAVIYGCALMFWPADSLKGIILEIGIFSTALLLTSAFATSKTQ